MKVEAARCGLIDWYDAEARTLPWRSDPQPWAVLISELMLQQTQVKTVLPRFGPFLAAFPSPAAMVAAGEDAVIAAWAGLGYYRRARSLFAAAARIVAEHDGEVPSRLADLLELPGVGAYTAAAVGSIAFGLPAAVVDGNVERVVARLYAIDQPARCAAGRRTVQQAAEALLCRQRPGDHNQAMMELGARICRPRQAHCADCPLASLCRGKGRWFELPKLPPRPAKVPQRHERRWLLLNGDGQVAWLRRPDRGIYAGLPDLPSEVAAQVQASATTVVRQRLSHLELVIEGVLARVEQLPERLHTTPVEAFLAAGPPTPVLRLVRQLLGR